MKKYIFILIAILAISMIPMAVQATIPPRPSDPPAVPDPAPGRGYGTTAWARRAINDISINPNTITRTGDNNYTIPFSWLRPTFNQPAPDGGNANWNHPQAVPGERLQPQWPEWYDIGFRNATENEVWSEYVFNSFIIPDSRRFRHLLDNMAQMEAPRFVMPQTTLSFPRSSLIEIWVDPMHLNRVADVRPQPPPANDIWDFHEVIPPMSTTPPNIFPRSQSIIFMTDVEVRSVQATPDTLIIEWFEPRWSSGRAQGAGSPHLFPGWQIAWEYHNPASPAITLIGNPIVNGAGRRILPTSSMETLMIDGRWVLRATITGLSLTAARQLNVRVEPLRQGPIAGTWDWVRPIGPDISNFNQTWPNPLGDHQYVFAARGTRNGLANEYRNEFPIMVEAVLIGANAGPNTIRLIWSSLAGIGNIDRVVVREIYDPSNPDSVVRILNTLRGTQARTVNWQFIPWLVPRTDRHFVVAVYLVGVEEPILTNVVSYYDQYEPFTSYAPIVRNAQTVVQANNGLIQDLEFLAFTREPFTDSEEAWAAANPRFGGRFLDQEDLSYRVYIFDDWNMRDTLLLGDFGVSMFATQLTTVIRERPLEQPGIDEPLYIWPGSFTHFYTNNESTGAIESVPLVGNQSYHIMVVGVRNPPPPGVRSTEAFYRVFMHPFDDIAIPPTMISGPPVRITDGPSATSVEIGWDLRYFEIEEEVTGDQNRWHAAAWPNGGNLVFGLDAFRMEGERTLTNRGNLLGNDRVGLEILNPDFNSKDAAIVHDAVTRAGNALRTSLSTAGWSGTPPFAVRLQDFWGLHFQYYTLLLDDLLAMYDPDQPLDISYEHYIRNHLPPMSAWSAPFLPDHVGGFATHLIEGLRPNTAYIILLRPIHPEFGPASLPAYILVTTDIIRDPVNPIPTTPILRPWPPFISDSTVGVYWEAPGTSTSGQETTFAYTLRWSTSVFYWQSSEGGIIEWDEIVELINDPDNRTEVRDGNIYFDLRDLFPDTVYYLWVMAENYNDPELYSSWSNPVDIRTLDISPPPPPQLNQATAGIISMYNALNTTTIKVSDPEAINILLGRIIPDRLTPRDDTFNVTGGAGTHLVLPPDTHARMYLLRFTGLLPNRPYYVRARSILTVTRGDPNVWTYAYEVQVSATDDFLDAISMVIPAFGSEAIDPNPALARRLYSVWTDTIIMFTGATDDEFDGPYRPDQFPMPERDWEMSYDARTQTLTWRFRSNQTDNTGRPDQNADQRFISRLVQERIFTYSLDISSYNSFPITHRVVEIPESIMRAFNERLITLDIQAGDLGVSIPPGAFSNAQNMTIGSYYRISLSINPEGLPSIHTNTNFAASPSRLEVRANQNILQSFARPLTISFPLEGNMTPTGISADLMFSSPQTGGWQNMNSTINYHNETIDALTHNPGTIAPIIRTAPPIENNNNISSPIQTVTNRLTITDMLQFNPNAIVTTQQFNNFVHAIGTGQRNMTMNTNLSNAERQTLERARLFVNGNLTREVAMDTLVRLYELRTHQIIRPVTTVSQVPGMQNVTATLQNNLLKAADIGFITGPLIPQGQINMGELMHMLEIIIIDAGL